MEKRRNVWEISHPGFSSVTWYLYSSDPINLILYSSVQNDIMASLFPDWAATKKHFGDFKTNIL